jgi:hypothetical protein
MGDDAGGGWDNGGYDDAPKSGGGKARVSGGGRDSMDDEIPF